MSVLIFCIVAAIAGLVAIKFLLSKNIPKNPDEE